MRETIDYYNRNAESFVVNTVHADMSDIRNRFLKYVGPGGKILDAGCGSGRDSLAFLKAGYAVEAFDASEELCRIATDYLGFKVECKRFEELDGSAQYDGIWACASLLHVKGEDLPDIVKRMRVLLKPDGVLYASFKEGETEGIREGRFFHDMTLDACRSLFLDSGLNVLELFKSRDVRGNYDETTWINIIGQTN